jgi:putative ABC transport system permease protein
MFRNYFITAFRHLVRYRSVTIFNVLGLSLGIAVCITIFIYVRFETSFDDYHPHVERIFRVEKISNIYNEIEQYASIPIYISDEIKNYEEVEVMGRFGPWRSNVVRYGDIAFKESGIFSASPGLFQILGIEVLDGDPSAGMERPMTAVLTETTAFKYFGNQPALGEMIELDTNRFEVVAIVKDFPHNTHAPLNIIFSEASMRALVDFPEEVHQGRHLPTYVKLHTWVDPDDFEERIRKIAHKLKPDMLMHRGEDLECKLRPIEEIHLNANQLNWDTDPGGNRVFLYMVSVIGFLILLMTSFNYMNLSTAQYSIRSREVGIRKTNGASRKRLVGQFLGESMMITLVSYVIGMFLVELFLPVLNRMGDMALDIHYNDPLLILFLIVVVLFIGILAGSYPAFFLSSFSPVTAIKGILGIHGKGDRVRKVLVIGQYAISITLIMATLIVFKQLLFMKNQSLGFNKESKLIIEFPENMVTPDNYEEVKEEFMRHSGVRATTISSSVPGRWRYWWRIWPTGEENTKTRMMNCMQVDYDFIEIYDLELLAGQAFDPALSDTTNQGWILNEAAVKGYGWSSPEEAMSKTMGQYQNPIRGVFRDYHFKGLQNSIEPLGVFLMQEDFRYITLVFEVAALEDVVKFSEHKFKELFPQGVFDFFFLDEDFERQYVQEKWISKLVLIFTILGVLIASLGLIGMISFTLENKKQEIGIRKVNGARARHVYTLLIRNFSWNIGIAFVLACPAAIFGGKAWLKDFAFQTSLSWWIFLSAGLVAWILAVAAISLQSLKAARQSPVLTLRYE